MTRASLVKGESAPALFVGILVICCATLSQAAVATEPEQSAGAPVPLGKLDAFWRYSPVLGPFLEQGQGLIEIPDYVQQGDFPYRKKPFPKEVPFADHLSVVRLLGGYSDGSDKGAPNLAVRERDLAYRDEDGTIRYRMELLRPRLQPYLDCGYRDFTFVLDNAPWCFPENPAMNSGLGQSSPPRDPEEWRRFIEAVCRQLALILGPDATSHIRFRVGTENNSRTRFDGTYREYIKHYDVSVSAVHNVFPGAQVGPCNFSGASVNGYEKNHTFAIAEESQAPWDWIAYSRYYRPGDDPAQHAAACRDVWEEFERRAPRLKGISREIHEFGVAPWGEVTKGAFASDEPGALGAALTCQMMWRLREVGIDRLWHWGVADRFRGRDGALHLLFTSQAWLFCVMDSMAEGDAYLFPPIEQSPGNTQYLAAGSIKPGSALIVISAYNTDIATHAEETVTFPIPLKQLKLENATVRFVRLTRQTAVHDRIREALAQNHLLTPDFVERPDRLGSIREMGKSREAGFVVSDRLEDYKKQWIDSLTLKPLTSEVGTVELDANDGAIRVRLAAPEVLVLDVESNGP